MVKEQDIYASRIFLNAALPLVKVLAEEVPALERGFACKNGVIQISAVSEEGLAATHFVVVNGVITVGLGISQRQPDLELRFKSVPRLNAFFKGDMKALPRIKGFTSPLFLPMLKTLLKLSGLLGAAKPPQVGRLYSGKGWK